MRISVQTDSFRLLGEIVDSNCSGVRFGSEFCEYKMPSLDVLERAYEIVQKGRKKFTYVTPRLSNKGIEKIKKHLALLNEKEDVDIVVNDLGALNILKNCRNMRPHLGRQLIRVPARSPWSDLIVKDGSLLLKRGFKKVFFTTSLNHLLSIEFFRSYGVRNVDVDWIPQIFPCFDLLIEQGLNLSVHLHLVPATLTRKCHTARFIGETSPEKCSKPCSEKAFLLKEPWLGLELFLHGNVVFTFNQPSLRDVGELKKRNVTELVLTMNPITRIDSRQKIDDFILFLSDRIGNSPTRAN